jgi:hypothetical protein
VQLFYDGPMVGNEHGVECAHNKATKPKPIVGQLQNDKAITEV